LAAYRVKCEHCGKFCVFVGLIYEVYCAIISDFLLPVTDTVTDIIIIRFISNFVEREFLKQQGKIERLKKISATNALVDYQPIVRFTVLVSDRILFSMGCRSHIEPKTKNLS